MTGKNLQLASTTPDSEKQLPVGRRDCLFNKRYIFSSAANIPSSV